MTEFDPSKHIRKMKGGNEYLDVKWRLVWLRQDDPEATVETKMLSDDPELKEAVFWAKVSRSSGEFATAHGSETMSDFRDYREKAETKAVGRALAMLGYGTQFIPDDDELIVDSPVEMQYARSGPVAPLKGSPEWIKKTSDAWVKRLKEVRDDDSISAQAKLDALTLASDGLEGTFGEFVPQVLVDLISTLTVLYESEGAIADSGVEKRDSGDPKAKAWMDRIDELIDDKELSDEALLEKLKGVQAMVPEKFGANPPKELVEYIDEAIAAVQETVESNDTDEVPY